MGSFTLTETRPLIREGRAPEIVRACVVLAQAPAPVAGKLRAGVEQLGLDTVATTTPEALRDALFDREVAVLFVYFGRDIPAGVATCRAVRRHPAGERTPIIAVVDEGALGDFSPDCGAEDVLVVPFGPREVALRVRLALWRRDLPDAEGVVKIGDLVVDAAAMTVRLRGAPVDLTYKEFALLRHFLHNPGVALSRSRILDAVWGDDYFGGDRTVDIHVRRLRAKLPPLADCIHTVHGVGYRYATAPELSSRGK